MFKNRMKRTVLFCCMVWLAIFSWQCRKPETETEPEKPEKYVCGRVIDRTDNTIVPNCKIGLYKVIFDGAFDRYTRVMETQTGADGKYEFKFTRDSKANKYCMTIDDGPDGFELDNYMPGFRNFISYNTLKQNTINQDITTISSGFLKVRFIGDGDGTEVILDGGGSPRIFKHGCDTIAWWSNESGKPANFGYSVYKNNTSFVNHEINDVMIKFDTVYKDVHF